MSSEQVIEQRRIQVPFAAKRFISLRPDDCSSVLACDVLVVGSGVAGLTAALAAARQGSVIVATKGAVEESNTRWAQGGIAAVLGKDDSVEEHVVDTLNAGAGLCHLDEVRAIVAEGSLAIRRLSAMGGAFDEVAGEISLGREGGHGRNRIVHARGDSTGLEVETVLVSRARSEPRIRILEDTFAVDLVTAQGAAAGMIVRSARGESALIRCKAIVLACGGAGQIYRETTNPPCATGDGIALAWRAGASMRGLEFVQFHPTTLYMPGVPRLLITEAVRGEGGYLRDRNGVRFMLEVAKDGELATRDVVSRAIVRRIIETGDSCVYLDVRHLDPVRFRARFPGITKTLDRYGIDFAKEPIPVHPAAHYTIGGVIADVEGRTSIPGLFAVGEVSSTGLHGANRLASNSLLEGLVCGHRAGIAAANETRFPTGEFDEGDKPDEVPPENLNRADLWNSLRSTMWKRVGIERDRAGLSMAVERLTRWQALLDGTRFVERSDLELVNAMSVAQLVARTALAREESRGTHTRTDFPERDDARWTCDLVIDERTEVVRPSTATPVSGE